MTTTQPPASDSGSPAAAAFAVPIGTTPEEIAAIAVVLLAASGSAVDANAAVPASAWGDPHRAVRSPITPGPQGWWASALAR